METKMMFLKVLAFAIVATALAALAIWFIIAIIVMIAWVIVFAVLRVSHLMGFLKEDK